MSPLRCARRLAPALALLLCACPPDRSDDDATTGDDDDATATPLITVTE